MEGRKSRVFMWMGIFLGLLVVLVATAVVLVATLDWNKAKPYVSATVAKATGRQLNMEGNIAVDWGWLSKLRAEQVRFENASWSKHPQMLELGSIDVEIDLWRLVREWRVVLPSVVINQLKVSLEKNSEGAANWDFRTAPVVTEPVTPDTRGDFPLIEKLVVKDSALLFDNQQTNARISLKLSAAEGSGFWEEPVKLNAKGVYQNHPFNLVLEGGSYQHLRSPDEPYPLMINLNLGRVKANINGTLTEPLAMKGEDVRLEISGDNMANLFPLIRLVFPSTPPYRLKGRLKHEGKTWSFTNFSGRVGDSDLSGNIAVDTGPQRPVMKADLVSNLLDFDDLAGFIGGTPRAGAGETATPKQKQQAAIEKQSDRVFPDQPYNLERLRAMDGDVRLRAKRILAPNLPIDNLNAKLSLKDGVLKFEPAALDVANGRVELYSTFDASKQPSRVHIDARFRQLEIKRLFGKSKFAEKSTGPLSGRIALSGTGHSFRELMATAAGNTFLVMSGGELSGLLVEVAGLDVAEALGRLVRGDKAVPIRCAALDFQGKEGQMGIQTLVFDTDDTIIFGEGSIDLRDEKVNIVLTPVPKDFSPFSLRSFVRVSGSFKNPSAFPDPLKTGTKSLLAKIFNVFLLVATSPVQPRDLWFGRDFNCDALLASLQEKDPRGTVLRDHYKNKQPAAKPQTNRLGPARH
ncbi:MAG TPA: AsmA family protein [Candidatus Binatia bacterium]|nr:AsmA family protein [Candidatus Binatia bacterium]